MLSLSFPKNNLAYSIGDVLTQGVKFLCRDKNGIKWLKFQHILIAAILLEKTVLLHFIIAFIESVGINKSEI